MKPALNPVFSAYEKLRHNNPELYYNNRTQRLMLYAAKRYGASFYDHPALQQRGSSDA